MNLLEKHEGNLTLTEQALTIKEFEDLYRIKYNSKYPSDNSGHKRLKANKVCKYIHLVYAWDSAYYSRPLKARKEQGLISAQIDWDIENDKYAQAAIKKFIETQSSNRSIRALESARNLVDKLIDLMNNVDLEERDENDRLIHKPNDYTKLIKEIDDATSILEDLEKRVKASTSGKTLAAGGQYVRDREK